MATSSSAPLDTHSHGQSRPPEQLKTPSLAARFQLGGIVVTHHDLTGIVVGVTIVLDSGHKVDQLVGGKTHESEWLLFLAMHVSSWTGDWR